jgi:hypothetical protein
MKETSMNEDDLAVAFQNEIWFANQILLMQSKPISHRVHQFAHDDFRFGITTAYPRHVKASLVRCVNVCH